jgi:hypothetical protein
VQRCANLSTVAHVSFFLLLALPIRPFLSISNLCTASFIHTYIHTQTHTHTHPLLHNHRIFVPKLNLIFHIANPGTEDMHTKHCNIPPFNKLGITRVVLEMQRSKSLSFGACLYLRNTVQSDGISGGGDGWQRGGWVCACVCVFVCVCAGAGAGAAEGREIVDEDGDFGAALEEVVFFGVFAGGLCVIGVCVCVCVCMRERGEAW